MSSEWYDVEKEMKRQEKQQRRRKCPAGITESEPEDCTHSSKKRRISKLLYLARKADLSFTLKVTAFSSTSR
jgi:hypothetical protein